MKLDKMSINKTEIELNDAESEELAMLILQGLEHLEEYHDTRFLKEHNAKWWNQTAQYLIALARYVE